MQWETHPPPSATSAAKGERSGPGVKGATYAVSPTPTFQGNSAPLPTSREHLGNRNIKNTKENLTASLHCLIQVLYLTSLGQEHPRAEKSRESQPTPLLSPTLTGTPKRAFLDLHSSSRPSHCIQ